MHHEQQLPRPPARLGKALKRGFSDVYDRLGLVVVASLTVFVLAAGPVAAGLDLARRGAIWAVPVGVAIGLLLGWPMAAGVFVLAKNITLREDPSLSDLKTGFTTLFGATLKLAIFDTAVTGVLAADAAFFLGRLGPAKALQSPVLTIVGLFFLYALLAWVMSLQYHLPLLAWQRPPTLTIVKRAFLLAADNPFFTIGLLSVIILLTILCVVPAFLGMAVLFMGAAAILATNALRELFIRYGIVEEPPEVVEDAGWPDARVQSGK